MASSGGEGGDRRAAAVRRLEAALGHSFADPALLERALTHASVAAERRGAGDNETLEFLGDRVLGLAIAGALVAEHPGESAGDLARRFAVLVDRASCARVARTLGIGEALRLPGGETRRGAREQASILTDACEAVIAALHLELGFAEAEKRVLALWRPLLDAPLDPHAANPKSALQERAAADGRPAPVYRVAGRSGPDHQPSFVVEVEVAGEAPARGEGGSLQAAEKAAALEWLRRGRGA